MAEVPEEIGACSVIVSEVVEGISYTVANISVHDIWAKFQKNMMAEMMQIMGKMTDVAS